ncbi:hypothetical protein [Flavihumibacter solisilvae]|uniref:MoxR-vWA-beta-propeller ternary system domain-containing protein n=1 Tax=Flavihumibacter solisilvae TaxID=1349421 RepID=A0A0C1IEN2_9BACT|nr:hypothetical protein [Flavihumibacter solisilvae]KIC92615.1 hypothetical protein OI18_21770 [Flavihumibacter solisilvae]
MPHSPGSRFLDAIYLLRTEESLTLHNGLHQADTNEDSIVMDFLLEEYERERLEYPGTPPAFNAAVALWGARTCYFAAQLLLFRKHAPEEISSLLPSYEGEITAAAMLSADLCLRFVPAIAHKAAAIDPNDPLVPLLVKHLETWHYSGLLLNQPPANPDLVTVTGDACLQQLYVNRIIETRNQKLAETPPLNKEINATLGNHRDTFWN